MNEWLDVKMEDRSKFGNLRYLKLYDVNNIDFVSNDYLGLARSEMFLSQVSIEWEKQKGLGSTGSRLISGNSSYIMELENKIADFHGQEASIIYNCGYMANLGLISAIAQEKDTLFFDVHIHASILDGIRLSKAKSFPFRHNDCNHLEERLKACSTHGNRYILIESIYSTDGSWAPLNEMHEMAQKYNAFLVVDEAHAIGVFGEQGKGLASLMNSKEAIFANVVTFGKALGVHGAAILGCKKLKERLVNFSKPFIYSTALPFFSLAAIKTSYHILPFLHTQRKHLENLINIFKNSGLSHSNSCIQPIFIKGNKCVKNAAFELSKVGFNVGVLMSPAVQKGYERLRICLHAFNTEKEVSHLINMIKKYGF